MLRKWKVLIGPLPLCLFYSLMKQNLCFKVTLNQYLDVPKYPIPTSEELFTKLNAGELFTKLDLSHAYQQRVLDESHSPMSVLQLTKDCNDTPDFHLIIYLFIHR